MQEANSPSPISTRPIAQLLNQLQRFLSQKQFKEAERNWQLLLHSFQQFTIERIHLFFEQTYLLHHYYLETKALSDAKLICSEIEKIEFKNPLLSKKLQTDFHDYIGNAYLDNAYYEPALVHLCTALQLNQQPEMEAALHSALTRLEVLALTQLITLHLQQSLASSDVNKLDFANTLSWLNSIQSLANRLTSQRLWEKVNELYQLFAPVIKRYLSLMNSMLHKKKQESLIAFSQTVSTLLTPVPILVAHHQYESALNALQSVIQHSEKEAQQFDTSETLNQIAQINAYHLGESSPPAVKTYFPLWQLYRNELAQIRQIAQQTLAQNLSITALQSQLTHDLKQLLAKMLHHCEELLGQSPPCSFSVIGIGSIARRCPGPYSDIDCAILVASKKYRHHAYFQTFVQLFKFHLDLLGENNPPGLHIDSGDLGHFISHDKDLINTPQGLAEHFDPAKVDISQPEPYSLHRPTLIYANKGGERLLGNYLDLLNNKFEFNKPLIKEPLNTSQNNWPLYQKLGFQYLQEHKRQFNIEVEKRNDNDIDLKKHYLSPLLFWLSDIALYFGIHRFDTTSILQELKQNNYLHPHFLNQLETAQHDLQRFRIQSQFKAKYQHDIVSKSNDTDNLNQFLLSESAYQRLQQIDEHVLQPAYRCIAALSHFNQLPFDPITADTMEMIKAALDPKQPPRAIKLWAIQSLQLLAYMLIDRNTALLDHRMYYQRLPTTLREAYLRYLNEAIQLGVKQQKISKTDVQTLMDLLQHYPNPNGTRPAVTQKINHWEDQFLQQFTEPYNDSLLKSYKAAERVSIEWVTSKGSVKCLLKREIQQQLLDKKGDLLEVARKQLDGRRIVIPVKDQHGKIIAYAKAFPELPGVQIAVDALTLHLSGHGLLTHFIKLNHLYHGVTFPFLISRAVKGKNLQDAIRNGALAELDKALDTHAFTLKVLESLLIYPEDEKADNLVAVPFRNAHGQSRYQLLSIDSDHAFVDPLLQTGTTLNCKEKVQVKSLIFCMNAMQQPLDPHAIEEFLSLDPLTLMNDWLYGLQVANRRLLGDTEANISGIFTSEQIKNWIMNKENFCFVPVAFEPGRIAKIYQQFRRLQAALSSDDLPKNHLALLALMEPRLASYYEQAFQEHSCAEKRFAALPTDYVTIEEKQTQSIIYQSTFRARERSQRSITVTDEKQRKNLKKLIEQGAIYGPDKAQGFELKQIDEQYRGIQQLREELLRGETTHFFQLENADYIKEQVINSIDFKAIKATTYKSSVEIQQIILQVLPSISFRKLRLSHWQLNDKTLEGILKQSSELIYLDLRNCVQISDNSIRAIAKYCPHIEVLYLSQNEQLQLMTGQAVGISIPLVFTKLRRLQVDQCTNLTKLHIKAPQLEEFNASQCTNLNTASTASQALVTINLTDCPQLHETQLVKIAENAKHLVNLTLKGCTHIKHIKFREKFPFVSCLEWNVYPGIVMKQLYQYIREALIETRQIQRNITVQKILEENLTGFFLAHKDKYSGEAIQKNMQFILMLQENAADALDDSEQISDETINVWAEELNASLERERAQVIAVFKQQLKDQLTSLSNVGTLLISGYISTKNNNIRNSLNTNSAIHPSTLSQQLKARHSSYEPPRKRSLLPASATLDIAMSVSKQTTVTMTPATPLTTGYNQHGLLASSLTHKTIVNQAIRSLFNMPAAYDYYHQINRKEAERLLSEGQTSSTFIIRSSLQKGSIAISYLDENLKITNIPIKYDNHKWLDESGQSYDSLLDYLQQHQAMLKIPLAITSTELNETPANQLTMSLRGSL